MSRTIFKFFLKSFTLHNARTDEYLFDLIVRDVTIGNGVVFSLISSRYIYIRKIFDLKKHVLIFDNKYQSYLRELTELFAS